MKYYLIAPAKTFHSSDNLLTYSSETPLKSAKSSKFLSAAKAQSGLL